MQFLKTNSALKTFIITYDLRQPERNYSTLYAAIKNMAGEGNWQHPLESVWVVSVLETFSANDIYNVVRNEIDDNDSLFIADITAKDRQGWLAKSFWEWMKNK